MMFKALMSLFTAVLVLASAFAASALAADPPSELDLIRGKQGGETFALADAQRQFVFPQDHGPHPDFRHEWWYVTGNLDSDSGERFGFELAIFRVGLRPAHGGGFANSQSVSGWRTRQVLAAHFAITDVARHEFRYIQKLSRDALGLSGAQAEPFRVWVNDWFMSGDIGAGDWKLHAAGDGYELSLDAQSLLAPVLNGEQGLSRKSSEPGAASYYYSVPRVAVHGTLARQGVVSNVHGLAWLDREWGSGSLGSSQQGWDWYALQLADGSALMFYALREKDGSRDPHSAGTWVDAAGHSRPLSAQELQVDVRDHWVSKAGARYPSAWHLRAATLGLDVEVSPVLPDQELGTSPRYWEGAVDVRGNLKGQPASGRGYVELVGYAR